MTNYIVLLFAYSIEALIIYIYFNENYNAKFKPVITILAGQGFMGLSFLLNIPFAVSIYINVFSFFVLTALYGISSFKISIKSTLFHSAIITLAMLGTEVITELVSAMLFGDTVLAHKSSTVSYILFVIVSKTLLLVLLYFVATLFSYKRNNALGDMKKTYLSLLYPGTICLFILLLFYIATDYKLSNVIMSLVLVLTIVSIISSCFIVVYNQQMQRRENELAELEKQQLKNEIDIQYLSLLEKKNQDMQILAHDYKNHLSIIRELGNNEQISEYIDKMTSEINASGTTCRSGNKTLDIIISKYITECELKHIGFDFDTKQSNLAFVEPFDLVSLLGNLLDNAIEAAGASVAKKILLKTGRKNSYETIVISNSCDVAPKKGLKTTKSNDNHGIGLKSISNTLKKYNGDYLWEYDNNVKQFTITLILLNN